MAVEWGSDQVRVVGLAPGPVAETEGMRKLGKSQYTLKVTLNSIIASPDKSRRGI